MTSVKIFSLSVNLHILIIMLTFNEMKECLFTYEYPNVQLLDEGGIADLFGAPNRKFLVKWILNIVNASFDLSSDENLCSILAGYGFCSDKKSKLFLEGKLDLDDTLKTLCRLFLFVKELKKDSSELSLLELSSSPLELSLLDATEDLRDMDLNLFPEYGPLRRWSEKEEAEKLQAYELKLKHLDPSSGKPNKTEHLDLYEIEREVLKLGEVLNDMGIGASEVFNRKFAKPLNIRFKNEENILKLSKNIEEYLQFTADIDVIENCNIDLNKENDPILYCSYNDEEKNM